MHWVFLGLLRGWNLSIGEVEVAKIRDDEHPLGVDLSHRTLRPVQDIVGVLRILGGVCGIIELAPSTTWTRIGTARLANKGESETAVRARW